MEVKESHFPLKILIFGGSGMLGNTVVNYLVEKFRQHNFISTFKSRIPSKSSSNLIYAHFDIDDLDSNLLTTTLRDIDIVINCAGLIWQKANDSTREIDYFRVNYEFPLKIQELQSKMGFKHIHIGTDCVFNGNSFFPYTEVHDLDASDIYGLSKAKAEIELRNATILRSSIIGHSPGQQASLLDWFLARERGSRVHGYKNHYWNGIGAVQMARILSSFILEPEMFFEGVQHIVPSDTVTKFELLSIFGEEFDRTDIRIEEHFHELKSNHLLATTNPNRNNELWKRAGYSEIPTIRDMVKELVVFYKKEMRI